MKIQTDERVTYGYFFSVDKCNFSFVVPHAIASNKLILEHSPHTPLQKYCSEANFVPPVE